MITFSLRALSLVALVSVVGCGGDADNADTAADAVDTAQHGAVTLDTNTSTLDSAGHSNAGGAAASSDLKKINLNTATNEELRTVPGIGDKMVHEFEEYRPYRSIAQFRKEIGKYVDAATVAEYEKHVFVPVDPNESDAATMQQIPGVDAAIAEQLIAARPYASSDAFLQKLGTLLSPAQTQTAAMYIATK